MFPYFGRKQAIVAAYPPPLYDVIVEPFAGSMSYACHHRPTSAIGVEADSEVVDLWHRLLGMSRDEIAAMREPEVGTVSTDLLVRLCAYSDHSISSPALKVTPKMARVWRQMRRVLITDHEWARRSVGVSLGSFADAPDVEATWFVDPPYQVYAGTKRGGYRIGADRLDFGQLAEWVRTRRGQVVVCEQAGADWLPFSPLRSVRSASNARSTEVVWFNDGHDPRLFA